MRKLLFISNFPFSNPMHGGQIRSHEILNLYKSLGYIAKVIVIKPQNTYLSDKADYEFIVSESYTVEQSYEESTPYLGDFLCGKFVKDNLDKILEKIGIDYDLVHCEMPWLFDLALEIKNRNKQQVTVVLGTENVESELKAKILSNAKIRGAAIDKISVEIDELERQAVEKADIVLAVSSYDYTHFSNMVKNKEKLILASNGIAKDRFKRQDDTILKTVGKGYFLFVGSAHMPNVTGFGEMFSHSLLFLPPDFKLVVVGGVSTMLEQDSRFFKNKHLNDSRIVRLNNLEESKLNSLILNANAILLPVVDGGGSNLKTAEALYSNRTIIGTSKSFVGYEKFLNHSGVFIANSPKEFAEKMRSLLNIKMMYYRDSLEELTWSYTLKGLAERVAF